MTSPQSFLTTPLLAMALLSSSAAADIVGALPTASPEAPAITSGATMTTTLPSDLSLPTGTAAALVELPPPGIEPLFVKPFVRIEPNRNDSNPRWSRSGMFLAFERNRGDKKEIRIAQADGTVFQTIYYQVAADAGEMQFFFPGVVEETSYNAGLSWSPREDRFVFMSNGGEGNYDLFMGDLGGKETARLTDHKEKDGHADWSPTSDVIVFVSGRTGSGDLYLMELPGRSLTRLTRGGKAYLYPQWSPEGKRIAVMHGSNENHDIFVMTDVAKPADSLRPLTTWEYDDLRPVWSPDGKKIAFYSNYNEQDDPKIWSIVVVAADGSDPTAGAGLAAQVIATDVIPDVEQGPSWMPDSDRIVYVKNDRREYNPLYVAGVRDRTDLPVKTDTKMNHDVTCAPDGTIAFRAQVNQWDHIFIAKLKE